MKQQQIMENSNNFVKSTTLSSYVMFCSTSSPKSKEVQFSIIYGTKKDEITKNAALCYFPLWRFLIYLFSQFTSYFLPEFFFWIFLKLRQLVDLSICW